MEFEPLGKDFFFSNKSEEDPRIELLKQCELFNDLPDSILEKIADLLHKRTFEREENIFSRDEPSSAMFLIESGKVEIYRDAPDSPRWQLATLGTGDFFGELAITEEHKRTAGAAAAENSTIQVLFRQEFLNFASRNVDYGFKIILNLSRMIGYRLRTLNDRYFELLRKAEELEKEKTQQEEGQNGQ